MFHLKNGLIEYVKKIKKKYLQTLLIFFYNTLTGMTADTTECSSTVSTTKIHYHYTYLLFSFSGQKKNYFYSAILHLCDRLLEETHSMNGMVYLCCFVMQKNKHII